MGKTIQVTSEARKKYRPLTEVMGLEDLDIVAEEYDEESNTQYFYCVARWEVAVCPECLQISHKVHDYPKQRQIHDTPIRGKQVLLLFDSMRFECEQCKKPFTQKIRDVVPECTYTQRLYEEIADTRRKQDVATIARMYGLGYKLVESIVLKAGEAKLEDRRDNPLVVKHLGIDEIAQKKDRDIMSSL